MVWYTSLAGSSYKELAQGFEKKYPGVKVDVYRAASNELMARITAEAQGAPISSRHHRDDFAAAQEFARRWFAGGLHFAASAKYPAHAKERAGNGLYYWGVNRESFIGVGYNPNLIPASAVPKNFDGLLNPQLKGKMGMTTSDTGVRMMGAMLKFKGEEFVAQAQSARHQSAFGFRTRDGGHGDLR